MTKIGAIFGSLRAIAFLILRASVTVIVVATLGIVVGGMLAPKVVVRR